MAAYIIGYDLMKPGKDYTKLFEAIKALGPWWHGLDSTWIVISESKAGTIRDALVKAMDGNDRLFVAALTGETSWSNLSNDAAQWLRNQFK